MAVYSSSGTSAQAAFHIYDPNGRKMGEYYYTATAQWSRAQFQPGLSKYIWYLGSKRVDMSEDQVGLNWNQTQYYPWGQVQAGQQPSETQGFGTCVLDGGSGLYYADQRYYNPAWGRFQTADPSNANVELANPGSFNRYAYANGDPIGSNDPGGRGGCPTWQNCVGRGLQVAGGAVQATGGALVVAASLTAEVGSGGLATVFVAVGVIGGVGEVMSGLTSVAAGISGDQSLAAGAQGVSVATNPVSLVWASATGDMQSVDTVGSSVGLGTSFLNLSSALSNGTLNLSSLEGVAAVSEPLSNLVGNGLLNLSDVYVDASGSTVFYAPASAMSATVSASPVPVPTVASPMGGATQLPVNPDDDPADDN
jgi:RHS repeat-associated protein